MKRVSIATIAATAVYFFFSTARALAAVNTDFPVCANPQGTIVASYASGVHGIPGNLSENVGSDTVYQLNNLQYMQCFCREDGAGIQTNWLNTSGMSQQEIDSLVALGWIYIPTGKVWGLDDVPFLAKNTDFNCKGSSSGSSNSDSSNSTSSSNGGTGGPSGSVLGAAAGILGYASTGNILTLYGLAGSGITSLLLGLFLRKVK